MIQQTTRRVFLCLGLGLSVGAAVADATPAQGADAAVKSTTEQIRVLIRQHHDEYKANQAKFYQAVNDVVVPRFDVPYIAKLVLSKNYRTATPDQRTHFANAFKDMLLHSYANAMLDNYDSAKIDWMPARLSDDKSEAAVNSTVKRDNGQTYAIGFRVHAVDGDWKIYDITVENVSLVLNFKTQIDAEIKRSSLDEVIARMEQGQYKPANPEVSKQAPSKGG
ncbi:MAG: ABC transporter substrate-binding protein [Nevskia sp.]|nr:ABC transporter substrate-binding protein [Nevskia sp.]